MNVGAHLSYLHSTSSNHAYRVAPVRSDKHVKACVARADTKPLCQGFPGPPLPYCEGGGRSFRGGLSFDVRFTGARVACGGGVGGGGSKMRKSQFDSKTLKFSRSRLRRSHIVYIRLRARREGEGVGVNFGPRTAASRATQLMNEPLLPGIIKCVPLPNLLKLRTTHWYSQSQLTHTHSV